jgi:hypothetical protein
VAAAAAGTDQPELTHQPLDCAPGDRDAFTVERKPHLPRAVDAVVLRMHPADLGLELGVAQLPPSGLLHGSSGVVVGGRGDRAAMLGQHSADRLDTPAQPTIGAHGVLGDEPHERGEGRSSSAAKKADAAFKISLARRSSAFSRRNRLSSADSSVVVPAR